MNDEPKKKRPVVGDDGELLEVDTSVEYTEIPIFYEPDSVLLADEPIVALAPPAYPPSRASKPLFWVIVVLTMVGCFVIYSFVVQKPNENYFEDRTRLASALTPGSLMVLPGNFYTPVRTSETSRTPINECNWSPDGIYLAIDNFDNHIGIWDVASGTETLNILIGADGIYWSPDGTRLLAKTTNGVGVWDAETGEHQFLLTPDTEASLTHLEWSLDSSMIAAANVLDRRVLSIYSAATGSTIQSLDLQTLDIQEPINGVAWTQGGLFAITPHYIIRWDIEMGQYEQFQTIDDTVSPVGRWISIETSDDGRYVAVSKLSGDVGEPIGQILMWDTTLPQSEPDTVLTLVENRRSASIATLSSIAWSPDNLQVATKSDADILIWDIASGVNLRRMTLNNLVDIDWSPDGRHLAACTHDYVRVYSLTDPRDLPSG